MGNFIAKPDDAPATMTLSDVNRFLFQRYALVIEKAVEKDTESFSGEDLTMKNSRTGLHNLMWMCKTGGDTDVKMPDDKASRWPGFVQGCLAMRNLIDVDEERNITRPMFHSIAGRVLPTMEYPSMEYPSMEYPSTSASAPAFPSNK